jgi:predicted membrane protein
MNNRQIVGVAIIVLGLSFLFDLPFFSILLSLLIIYAGVRILQGNSIGFPFASSSKINSSEHSVNRVLIFSSMDISNESQEFTGAEVVSVFGQGNIDLSKTRASSDRLKISLVSVFGSINVKVPNTWDISTEGVGVLGTFSNNTSKPATKESAVQVEGVSIFGSIQIRN